MRFVLAVAAVTIALTACQRVDPYEAIKAERRATLAAWLQTNRAAATAQLDRIRAVAAAAKAHAPLEGNAVEPTRLDYYDPTTGSGNAEVLALPDLENPGTPPEVADVVGTMVDTTFLHGLAHVVSTGAEHKDLEVSADPSAPTRPFDQALKHLLGLEYLVVVKQTEYVAPQVAGGGSFIPGTFRADALVYRVSDAAYLGGVRIGVTNKSQVKSYDGQSSIYLKIDLEEGIGPVTRQTIRETLGQ